MSTCSAESHRGFGPLGPGDSATCACGRMTVSVPPGPCVTHIEVTIGTTHGVIPVSLDATRGVTPVSPERP